MKLTDIISETVDVLMKYKKVAADNHELANRADIMVKNIMHAPATNESPKLTINDAKNAILTAMGIARGIPVRGEIHKLNREPRDQLLYLLQRSVKSQVVRDRQVVRGDTVDLNKVLKLISELVHE